MAPVLRLLGAALPALMVLCGCQQGENPKPFWASRKPAPALREMSDIDVARSSGAVVSRPKPKPKPKPKPVVAIPEPPKPQVPVRAVTVGRSVKGVPIQLYIIGSGVRPTLILFGIHGDEPIAGRLGKKFTDCLLSNSALLTGQTVALMPLVNPDGMAVGTRQNARKVDCNRNFPAKNWARSRPTSRYHGGIYAGSEPETQAIVQAVRITNPRQIISVHSISRGRFCNNYDGPGRSLAEAMARHNRYPVKGSIGYPTPGSFGTWAGIDRAIPTVTLEMPDERPREKDWWPQNYRALMAAIRHTQGGASVVRRSGQGTRTGR